MRGDGKLSRSIRDARSWRNSSFDAELEAEAGSKLAWKIGLSFSGNERNKLFFSREAKQFADLSAVSGLDSAADSRVLALWDFDRDGWQDMVVANANAPLLNIYHNEIGAGRDDGASSGKVIAIRFVGGNVTSQSSHELSCRDGYGTKVRVAAGEFTLMREHRCGEGMAGQNSSTMVVGIGDNAVAKSVDIHWSSGVQQQLSDIPAGTLLTVYEDPESAPEKLAVSQESYVVPSTIAWEDNDRDGYESVTAGFRDLSFHESPPDSGGASESRVRLYTTMATWCEACKNHLPELGQLRSKLGLESLSMYGVPIDPADDPAKLSAYAQRFQPSYELLPHLTDDQRQQVKHLATTALSADVLPSTIVTDNQGTVLLVTAGLPTVSELKKVIRNE